MKNRVVLCLCLGLVFALASQASAGGLGNLLAAYKPAAAQGYVQQASYTQPAGYVQHGATPVRFAALQTGPAASSATAFTQAPMAVGAPGCTTCQQPQVIQPALGLSTSALLRSTQNQCSTGGCDR